MDLTGQAEIKTSYAQVGDNLVLTLKDSLDNELGSVIIEVVKFRSFIEVLNDLAQLLTPNGSVRDGQRSEINVEEQSIETEFG